MRFPIEKIRDICEIVKIRDVCAVVGVGSYLYNEHIRRQTLLRKEAKLDVEKILKETQNSSTNRFKILFQMLLSGTAPAQVDEESSLKLIQFVETIRYIMKSSKLISPKLRDATINATYEYLSTALTERGNIQKNLPAFMLVMHLAEIYQETLTAFIDDNDYNKLMLIQESMVDKLEKDKIDLNNLSNQELIEHTLSSWRTQSAPRTKSAP